MPRHSAVLRVAVTLAAPFLTGCGKEDPRFLFERKPIPGIPYQGFRRDIPAGRRGNAVFSKGVFTRDGRYLVTLGPGPLMDPAMPPLKPR
jgi:hypothetical protein